MIPAQAMIQTMDVTASLAPVSFSMALAAMVCGAVLITLGCGALRADSTASQPSGAAEMDRPAPSPLGLHALEHPARAA